MLAATCLFPVPKPPCFAHAIAAVGVARKLTNALMAGVSRNVTNRSPPISTELAFAPGVIAGQANVLKPVAGFAFVGEVKAPADEVGLEHHRGLRGLRERVRDRVVETVL